ncbi:hypothetical protein MTO96_012337 [Rhipicephalus appendiculatus]
MAFRDATESQKTPIGRARCHTTPARVEESKDLALFREVTRGYNATTLQTTPSSSSRALSPAGTGTSYGGDNYPRRRRRRQRCTKRRSHASANSVTIARRENGDGFLRRTALARRRLQQTLRRNARDECGKASLREEETAAEDVSAIRSDGSR